MDNREFLRKAKEAIVEADEMSAMKLIDQADDENFDLLELLVSGFSEGNQEIGYRFDRGSISLPELMYASETMKNVTIEVLDRINNSEDNSVFSYKGTVILATVAGDIHDIGKGIVASTLKAAGFRVIDLGCEVPVERIVEEALKYDADIIGTSALLTSTMTEQKKLEKLLVEKGEKKRFITMVGGAPCTPRWAKKIGASGYSENAVEAVRVAFELINEKKSNE